MPIYIARFTKSVCDDRGHEKQICQRAIPVRADARDAAEEEAKRRFCDAEGVGDWSFRADRFDLDLAQAAVEPKPAPRPRSGAPGKRR